MMKLFQAVQKVLDKPEQVTVAPADSKGDVVAYLRRMAELEQKITALEAAMNSEKQTTDARYVTGASPLVVELEALQNAVIKFCADNKDSLLDGKGKTLDLGVGTVKWSLSAKKLEVAQDFDVITQINELAEQLQGKNDEQRGMLLNCVRSVQEINVEAVKNLPAELLNQLDGVQFSGGDEQMKVSLKQEGLKAKVKSHNAAATA